LDLILSASRKARKPRQKRHRKIEKSSDKDKGANFRALRPQEKELRRVFPTVRGTKGKEKGKNLSIQNSSKESVIDSKKIEEGRERIVESGIFL